MAAAENWLQGKEKELTLSVVRLHFLLLWVSPSLAHRYFSTLWEKPCNWLMLGDFTLVVKEKKKKKKREEEQTKRKKPPSSKGKSPTCQPADLLQL